MKTPAPSDREKAVTTYYPSDQEINLQATLETFLGHNMDLKNSKRDRWVMNQLKEALREERERVLESGAVELILKAIRFSYEYLKDGDGHDLRLVEIFKETLAAFDEFRRRETE